MQTHRLTKNAVTVIFIAVVVLNGWFFLPQFRQQDDLGTAGGDDGES